MTNMYRALTVAAAVMSLTGAASAHELVFTTQMSGPAESPPNASAGTGTSTVTFDLDLSTMRVQAVFSGLTGNVSAAHIHAPTAAAGLGTAGVATPTPTFPSFPLGNTFGTYDQTFDLTLASSYNAGFITASGGTVAQAMNRLIFAFSDGKAYLNIHSSLFPGGEIRGFYVPAPGAVVAFAAAGLVASRRRRA